jgi:FKBP-type peptidyl-prolyl cis-trans isomerase (trigger factor)
MSLFRKQATTPSSGSTSVSISETAPCEKSLRLQVAPEVIAPVRAAVVAEVQRDAALPGFRKGKAPPELVEQRYGERIKDETLHRVMQQALEQAAKDHRLKPVGPFEVKRADFDEEKGLTLEATVEVEPTFSLETYKGIPLTRQNAEVTPEELAKALGQLAESMAQLVPKGDSGEKERRVPPIDDELAKDLRFKDLAALKEHVEAKLREQKRAAQAAALEAALCDELLKRHSFQVPARLVGHQTERLTRDFKVRLLLSGMTEEQVNAEAGKFTEQLRTSAERRVKLMFLLDRIAAAESVNVTQDELVGRLWQLSQRWKKDPAEVRKIFDAQGLWPSVVSTLRQEKTMTWLLSAAVIDNGLPT